MSIESQAIQINFGRPVPLFPLDSVTLFPQQLLPLHIFEPRYRQMVAHALDGAGLIAMAVFDGFDWRQQYHARPKLRPIVCVGHIAGHERVAGDDSLPSDDDPPAFAPAPHCNIVLQGVCRARIVEEMAPDSVRLYRLARLEPIGIEGKQLGAELYDDEAMNAALDRARERVTSMLEGGPLNKLAQAEPLIEFLRNDEVPSEVALEVVGFKILSDPALRYRMLAEGDARARATMLLDELTGLERLARLAAEQHPEQWPKGQSWN
jgi:Lon protease-like protein